MSDFTTTHGKVLRFVASEASPDSASYIAFRIVADAPQTTVILTDLAAWGLVESTKDDDGLVRWQATDAGRTRAHAQEGAARHGRSMAHTLVEIHQALVAAGEDGEGDIVVRLKRALAKQETVAYLVSDFVPGDPERDAVGAHLNLFERDQREHAEDYARDPGPVDRQLLHGPAHIYRVVRDQ